MGTHNHPRVGFVVLSWNGSAHLQTCLDSLVSQDYSHFSVCLVDNGSTDTTQEVFDQSGLIHKILVTNKKNRGFAPAVNQGIAKTLETYPKIDYIVLLNNDVILDKSWLSTMLRKMDSDATIGFAQGENFTNSSYRHYECTGIYIEEGFIPRQKTTLDSTPTVVGPNAAAIMMRRKFIDDMTYRGQLLDSRFFAYVEDVDLLLRAFTRGWGHALVRGARAIHAGSATGNRVAVKKMFWGSRNLVWLVVKNVPLSVFRKKAKKIVVSRLADIEYLFRTNRHLAFAYIYGLIVGIFAAPLFLRKRYVNLGSIKISDEAYIGALTPSNPPLTNPLKALRKRMFNEK